MYKREKSRNIAIQNVEMKKCRDIKQQKSRNVEKQKSRSVKMFKLRNEQIQKGKKVKHVEVCKS